MIRSLVLKVGTYPQVFTFIYLFILFPGIFMVLLIKRDKSKHYSQKQCVHRSLCSNFFIGPILQALFK